MKNALNALYKLTIKIASKIPLEDFVELREEWNRVMSQVEKELK
jgi:hypothetical protein